MSRNKVVLTAGAVIFAIGVLSILIGMFLGASGVSITTKYGTPTHTLVNLVFAALFVGMPALGVLLLIVGAVMTVRNRKLGDMTQTMPDLGETPVVAGPQYATFWPRAAAFMIDGLLYSVGCMLLGSAVILLITFMPEQLVQPLQLDNAKVGSFIQWGWLTVVPFLVFSLPLRVWGGQTVGKKIMGIKVVDNLGNALSWSQCVGRPMLYLLSMMGLLGFLWSLWDQEKRCWHDFIARTHVVRLR